VRRASRAIARQELRVRYDTQRRRQMMNVIDRVIDRIEFRRKENKVPCKNYKNKASAERATKNMAEIAGQHFFCDEPARYIVVYNEAWGRWIGAIDLTELLQREERKGGYLGICSSNNFYSY